MVVIVKFIGLIQLLALAVALEAVESATPPLSREVPLLRQNPHFAVLERCLEGLRKSDYAGVQQIASGFLPTIEKAADDQSQSLNDFPSEQQPTPELDAAALLCWCLGTSHYEQRDFTAAKPYLEKAWRKYPLARFRHPESFVWMPARDAYTEWLIIGYVSAIKEHTLDKYPFDPTLSIFHAAGAEGMLHLTPMTEATRFVFMTDGPKPIEAALNQMLASAEINGLDHSGMIEDAFSGLSAPADPDLEQGWSALLARLESWEHDSPGSSLPKIAKVGFWINYAWQARGDGYAQTVGDQGWKLFGERLNKALELQRKEIVPHPMWFVHGLILGRGLGADSSAQTAFFEEAIRQFPTFLPIYQQMQVYLLPRWHGAPGEWQQFAIWAARKAGPELYVDLYLNAEAFEGREVVENDPLIDWKFLREGFESKLKLGRLSWVVANQYAARACARNDKAAALAAFGNPATRFHPLLWNGLADFKHWREWAKQ